MALFVPLDRVAFPVPYDPIVIGFTVVPAAVRYSSVPENVCPPWKSTADPEAKVVLLTLVIVCQGVLGYSPLLLSLPLGET